MCTLYKLSVVAKHTLRQKLCQNCFDTEGFTFLVVFIAYYEVVDVALLKNVAYPAPQLVKEQMKSVFFGRQMSLICPREEINQKVYFLVARCRWWVMSHNPQTMTVEFVNKCTYSTVLVVKILKLYWVPTYTVNTLNFPPQIMRCVLCKVVKHTLLQYWLQLDTNNLLWS